MKMYVIRMSGPAFQFRRFENRQKLHTEDLAEVMRCASVVGKNWLIVSPHDDDMCIGAGLWMQAAAAAGVNVSLLVVTDGRMGYCRADQKDDIVAIRREETYRSCKVLGLDRERIHWINYPDGGLFSLQGRRAAAANEPAIEGFVGLQNAMTYYLRKIRPTRVLVPTPTDLHPDHQITYNELMISLFHAQGLIWPELGEPIAAVPTIYEMAVYCDFNERPNLELMADQASFDRKLDAIAAFKSQAQIAKLVENIRSGGPYEYLSEVTFRFYSPNTYRE